jgi:acyl-coenzyme A thioesterase PaaI-like protein
VSGGFHPVDGRAVGGWLGIHLREQPPATGVVTEGRAEVVGHVARLDHLRDRDGDVPLGVLLALVDTAAGICGGLAALPNWVVSASLHLHRDPNPLVEPLELRAATLRAGTRAVVTGCALRDGSGRVRARGVLTSAVLTPAGGPPYTDRPVEVRFGPPPTGPDARLETFVPVRRDGAAARVELLERLRNPWGILHGGVTGILADAAATGAAAGSGATAARPAAATVRFLSPARVGPVAAAASLVGARGGDPGAGPLCRVEVRDEGAGRVTAVATVTLRAGPRPQRRATP